MCTVASAVTDRPAARTAPDVTGPMEAMTAGTPSTPSRSTVRSTVDDEVKATASATRARSEAPGSTSPATVR